MRKKTALNSKKRRSTRKSKHNRLYRRKTHKRSIRSRKTGGDCGCGSKSIIGGSANLSQLDTKYYYPYNGGVVSNPQNPSTPIIEQTTGGQRYYVPRGQRRFDQKIEDFQAHQQLTSKVALPPEKFGKRMKFSKKMRVKGGMNAFDNMYKQYSNSGSNMDTVTSFGEMNGASKQADTITGMSSVSNSVTDQPVFTQPFGIYNPVLV